jgi:hypothetical protein
VRPIGSVESLICTMDDLPALPPELSADVRRLLILDANRHETGRAVVTRFGRLEHLTLGGLEHPWMASLLVHDLAALPRLRTLVIEGLPIGALPGLADDIPSVQLSGQALPDAPDKGWPRPS